MLQREPEDTEWRWVVPSLGEEFEIPSFGGPASCGRYSELSYCCRGIEPYANGCCLDEFGGFHGLLSESNRITYPNEFEAPEITSQQSSLNTKILSASNMTIDSITSSQEVPIGLQNFTMTMQLDTLGLMPPEMWQRMTFLETFDQGDPFLSSLSSFDQSQSTQVLSLQLPTCYQGCFSGADFSALSSVAEFSKTMVSELDSNEQRSFDNGINRAGPNSSPEQQLPSFTSLSPLDLAPPDIATLPKRNGPIAYPRELPPRRRGGRKRKLTKAERDHVDKIKRKGICIHCKLARKKVCSLSSNFCRRDSNCSKVFGQHPLRSLEVCCEAAHLDHSFYEGSISRYTWNWLLFSMWESPEAYMFANLADRA
jgi:hypothetical protein